MISIIDYALMAGSSYFSTRTEFNRFPIASNWGEMVDLRIRNDSSGFEATAFQRGNEIVISFAGTYDKDLTGDIAADASLVLGTGSDQLLQAADYYLQIRKQYPEADITLTGHSLGGGLASLIGVFFGVGATTFDQAPFAQEALFGATKLKTYLIGKVDADGNRIYSDADLFALSSYIDQRDILGEGNTSIPNSGLISNIVVQGEMLSVPPANFINRIGTTIESISNVAVGASGGDLHSQALLTAFLQSQQTAVDGYALNDVTEKLPNLLQLIFNPKLFSYRTDDPDNRNFIDHLVRHEVGVEGEFQADEMVTRFTTDLWKLAKDGGLTVKDGNPSNSDLNEVSQAMIAFAMQKYYEETAEGAGYGEELFEEISGGVQFDLANVSTAIKTALEAGQKANLKEAKGFNLYFSQYLEQVNTFTLEERGFISLLLPYLRDWYVQAGESGMNASDTLNRGAFMLGGSGNDTLTGGDAGDLLVGNAGDDTLNGGKGSDTVIGGAGEDTLNGNEGSDFLIGGAGADTYKFNGNYGIDVVTDSDGGVLEVGTESVADGGNKIADDVWESEDKKYLYTLVEGNLIVNQPTAAGTGGLLSVQDWQAGDFGINLGASNNPSTPANVLTGDFEKMTDEEGEHYVFFNGNYRSVGDQAGAADLITGTEADDWVRGLGGDDALLGRGGDDLIEGGDGNDVLQGGLGRDTIKGGTGRDLIYGSSNGSLYYPTRTDYQQPPAAYPTILAQGFSWIIDSAGLDADGFEMAFLDEDLDRDEQFDDDGNLIDGGAGEDTIFSGTGSDVVHGGDDNDDILGMGGNDMLFGDGGRDRIYGDGPSSYYPGLVVHAPAEQHGYDVIVGGAGDDLLLGQGKDDILYGGADDDELWGDDRDPNNTPLTEHGNDYLDGGTGADKLYGNGGDDILIGGTGNDELTGGLGRDTYIFNRGDGNDIVVDTKSEGNILHFGEGISSDDVTLRLDSLMLDLGNGDEIHIAGFDQTDALNSSTVQAFAFADGSQLTVSELLARGFDINGDSDQNEILGTNVVDRIHGLEGNDVLDGGAGDDSLFGDDGNDQLQGGDGNDRLDGAQGQDILFGESGDDILNGGGGGDDYLNGGDGNDTYLLLDQDGITTTTDENGIVTVLPVGGTSIEDSSGVNKIVFGQGITPNDLIYLDIDGSTKDFGLQYGQDVVMFANGLISETIALFEFNDGTTWTRAQIMKLAPSINVVADEGNNNIVGGASSDNLDGGAGDDLIRGGRGNDVLIGGSGNDTYLFDLGDGQDQINNAATDNATTIDRLEFGAGILANDIVLNRVSNDLLVKIGNDDSISISNYFSLSANAKIEQIKFADNTVWNQDDIEQHIVIPGATSDNDVINGFDTNEIIHGLDGNDVIFSGSGDDQLYGDDGSDQLYGQGGNDVLVGGLGGDQLDGGLGDDIYLLGIGDGVDHIYITVGNDVVLFKEGVLPTDVHMRRSVSSLVLDYPGGTAILDNFFSSDPIFNFQSIQFTSDPDTAWDVATIKNILLIGSLANDTLTGYSSSDFIDGSSGNDYIDGVSGDDQLIGGSGDDRLFGGEGSDSLFGGVGGDHLDGGNHNDILDGGAGNDILVGGSGNDVYFFGREDGHDIVNNFDTNATDIKSIFLKEDIHPDAVTLYRSNDDLVVVIDGSSTQMWVTKAFDSSGNYKIDEIQFSNGTIWIQADIAAKTVDPGVPDSLIGTSENNTFIVDNSLDTISEGINQGADTVLSSVTYRLANNLENITLTGVLNINATGNTLSNTILGNAGDNVLAGGINVLYSDSSEGLDTLVGGAGNDTYKISGEDIVIELENEGVDSVFVNFVNSYILPQNVENLIFGNDSYAANLVGNELDNILISESDLSEDVVIDGGAGADTMITKNGGIFYVDNVGDKIVANGKIQIFTSVDYALGESESIYVSKDEITLIGSDAIRATGNSGDNVLNGQENNASNILEGGAGNDRYVVGVNDVVLETVDGGTDTLFLNVTGAYGGLSEPFALFDNIENLEFSNATSYEAHIYGNSGDNFMKGSGGQNIIRGMSGNDTIIGNGVFDTLEGGGGNDSLTSGVGAYGSILNGGTGNDEMTGNGSSDTFLFSRGDGHDLIHDYSPAFDRFGNPMSSSDAIEFTGDITGDDATLTQNENNLIIYVGEDGDNITVVNQFGSPAYSSSSESIEKIIFSNGTFWDAAAIEMRIASNNSNIISEFSDVFTGTNDADSIDALNGDDNVSGGFGDDVIDGGVGNDVLFGNTGNDILLGGANTNMLYGGIGSDTYKFGLNSGTDFVIDPVNGDEVDTILIDDGIVPAQLQVRIGGPDSPDLVLSIIGTQAQLTIKGFYSGLNEKNSKQVQFSDGTIWNGALLAELGDSVVGTEDDDNLILTEGIYKLLGKGGNDTLTGLGTDDWLDGGIGADHMMGGDGDDTYFVDNSGDIIVEIDTEDSGYFDNVRSSISYTLGANVEGLELIGTDSINGTGNSLSNMMSGNAGDNILDGGLGTDDMYGGAGNDTYIVNHTWDSVTEYMGEGTDTIKSSVTYTLSEEIENLILTGNSGIRGTGNALDNTITGNSRANTIDGGEGADIMIGGGGNDIYVVDNASDVVTENVSAGTDTVKTSVTYALNVNLENLTLIGDESIDGEGNALNNVIVGNAMSNVLDGRSGMDSMSGGDGDDTYIVDNTSDSVTENIDHGRDAVLSSVTYALSTNIEDLILTGITAINGTGNAEDNFIVGNNATNTLTGGIGNDWLAGGAGNDILIGGSGDDYYEFGLGDGQDVVENAAADNATSIDEIYLSDDISLNDLILYQSGNDLIININANDAITVRNYYLTIGDYKIDGINAEDGTWDQAAIEQHVSATLTQFSLGGESMNGSTGAAVLALTDRSSWALSSSLLNFHLGVNNVAAIGENIVHQHANDGTLSNISLIPTQTMSVSSQFGSATQVLPSLSSLQVQ